MSERSNSGPNDEELAFYFGAIDKLQQGLPLTPDEMDVIEAKRQQSREEFETMFDAGMKEMEEESRQFLEELDFDNNQPAEASPERPAPSPGEHADPNPRNRPE